jgi:hypothetical protein
MTTLEFSRCLLTYGRLACALCAAFALLIFVVRAFGAAQPPPEALAYLHLSDCALPCWLGIVPGETYFTTAVERITALHPDSRSTSGYGTASISAYQAIPAGGALAQVGIYASNDGTVQQISVITAGIKGITFGDVVGFLGMPACNTRYPASAVYTSATAFAVLVGSVTDDGWRTRLNNIEILAIDADAPPCDSLIN